MRLVATVAVSLFVAASAGAGASPPREVLFVGHPAGGDAALLLLDLRRGETRTLVQAGPTSPRWSPDGTRIVYDTAQGLAVVSVAGGPPQAVTIGHDFAQSWSRDGAWIAFARYPEQQPQELWIVRPDGSHPRRLRAGAIVDASWSSDSRHLLVSERGGIVVVDLSGRASPLAHAATAPGPRRRPTDVGSRSRRGSSCRSRSGSPSSRPTEAGSASSRTAGDRTATTSRRGRPTVARSRSRAATTVAARSTRASSPSASMGGRCGRSRRSSTTTTSVRSGRPTGGRSCSTAMQPLSRSARRSG